jgi:hypothetical protein
VSVLSRVVPVDRRALRLYRANFWKILLVSAVVFAPLSLISALANRQAEDWADDAGNGPIFGIAAFAASALVIFGYALCAGLLDKLVVGPEFGHHKESLGQALRTLPYGRLVLLDLLTAVGIAIGLALGVLPGLVLFTFIALAPPLLVAERLGVVASMKRSMHLVRRAFWVTFLVVTLPVLVEHEIFAAVELLFELPLLVLWLAHLAAAVLVLALVVLCEITLALTLAEAEARSATADPEAAGPDEDAAGATAQGGGAAGVSDGLLSDA